MGNIWFQLDESIVHTAENTIDVLGPIWLTLEPQFDTVGILFVGCYADKPETSCTLNGNIRDAIGEIQLHRINNVFGSIM